MIEFSRWFKKRPWEAAPIEDALSQVVSPKVMRRARSQAKTAAELVPAVAKEQCVQAEVLLQRVAEILRLRPALEFHLPTEWLVEQSGYEEGVLRSAAVLPQYGENGNSEYILVVADPLVIDLAAYKRAGVEVRLGLVSSIQEVWRRYEQKLSAEEQKPLERELLLKVLVQLASDAASQGAKEVFIGHPSSGSYEFVGGDKRFSGTVHERVFKGVFSLLGGASNSYLPTARPDLGDLYLSLTNSFDKPVVFLSWGEKEQEESQAVVHCGAIDSEDLGLELSGFEKNESLDNKASAIEVKDELKPVLLVDDDPRYASILRPVFLKTGFQLEHEADGEAALARIESLEPKPELIVCDVHMPRMDGGAFLSKIKEQYQRIPVLMITSDDDDLLEVELADLGADAFVRKQENLRVLLAWCKNLANKGRCLEVA